MPRKKKTDLIPDETDLQDDTLEAGADVGEEMQEADEALMLEEAEENEYELASDEEVAGLDEEAVSGIEIQLGVLTARIAPGPVRFGLNVSEWTPPGEAEIVSVVAGLPNHIAVLQARSAEIALKNAGIRSTTVCETIAGGNGSYVNIRFPAASVPNLFSALGERGLAAENVGRAAAGAAIAWNRAGMPIDEYAADQLVLPLALAGGPSTFAVSRLTSHLKTNIDVVGKFLDRKIRTDGELDRPGRVIIE